MASSRVDARREDIVMLVTREGIVRANELTKRYGVSAATIHRDLAYLAHENRLERLHGGACSATDQRDSIVTDWSNRLSLSHNAKAIIGEYARQLVADGSTIFVDASTTGLALVKALEAHPPSALTLVTNSPAIAYQVHAESIHIVAAPGDLSQHVRAVQGSWTVDFIRDLHFSNCFISSFGITVQQGLVTTQRELAEVCSAAIESSERVTALLDAKKFDRTALISFATADQIDELVTSPDLEESVADRYRQSGYNLLVAQPSWRGEGGFPLAKG